MKYIWFAVLLLSPSVLLAAPTITLTQTACQFIEPENGDQNYQANSYMGCEEINHVTADERLEKSGALQLKAGEYVFRVYNKDVPYEIGRASCRERVCLYV